MSKRAFKEPPTNGRMDRGERPNAPTTLACESVERGRPTRLFVIYSRADDRYLNALRTQLAPLRTEGLLADWCDRMMEPGSEVDVELQRHLDEAELIVVLVSADLFASNYCSLVEIPRAIERHESGEARVMPILVRATDWRHTRLGRIQALPHNGVPVRSWVDDDEAWAGIAAAIRRAICAGRARAGARRVWDAR